MKVTTWEYSAPSYWASYLINGNASGIDDADRESADLFVEWVGLGAPVDCSEEPFFSHYPDFNPSGLGCDCVTYVFHEVIDE